MDPSLITKIASTAGILSTASFWSMNLTMDYIVFPALILGSPITSSSKSSPDHRFFVPSTPTPHTALPHLGRQWQEVFHRGHLWGPPSAIISGISFLTAAWHSSSGSNEQYLYASAAVAAMAVMPWTLIVVFPVNAELNRRADAEARVAEGKAGDREGRREGKEDDKEFVELLRNWVRYNDVRAGLAVVATALGVWAGFQ